MATLATVTWSLELLQYIYVSVNFYLMIWFYMQRKMSSFTTKNILVTASDIYAEVLGTKI